MDTYNLGTNDPSALTYEFWLKVEDPPSAKRGGLYGEFPSNTSGKNHTRNYFAISDGLEDKNQASFDQYPPSGNSAFSTENLFVDSQFMQLAMTISGDTVTFYVDGQNMGTATNNEEYDGAAIANTWIGARNDDNSIVDDFLGQMSVVRIYNGKALSDSEILQNYTATIPEPSAGVLLLLGSALVARRRRR